MLAQKFSPNSYLEFMSGSLRLIKCKQKPDGAKKRSNVCIYVCVCSYCQQRAVYQEQQQQQQHQQKRSENLYVCVAMPFNCGLLFNFDNRISSCAAMLL